MLGDVLTFRYRVDMPQWFTDIAPVWLSTTTTTRATVRLSCPAPKEPWEEAELWARLDRHHELTDAPAISIECDTDDETVTRATVYAVNNGLGLRWDLRPADWRSRPHDPNKTYPLEVHARDGAPPGQQLLSRLGLGRVQRALDGALRDPLAALILGEAWGAVEARRPGRRGQPLLRYARPALDYVRALEVAPRRPYQYIVDNSADHVTVDQVKAEIKRARQRGLLTEGTPGRAGGELTLDAIKELQRAGLLPREAAER